MNTAIPAPLRRLAEHSRVLVLLVATLAAAAEPIVIAVGPTAGDVVGADHLALQRAADLLAERASEGGGVLRIAEGVYTMRGALHLRVPMTVRGAGMRKTVLRKAAQQVARVAEPVALTATRWRLDDAAWLQPGSDVTIRYHAGTEAWGNVIRRVTAIDGSTVTVDLPIAAEPRPKAGDPAYAAPDQTYPAGAPVQHSHPLISAVSQRWATGTWISGIVIEDLTVDGNKAENAGMYVDGCRNGGIYLFRGERCAMRRVEVKDFAGDGFSWQFVHDMTVEHCVATGNGFARGARDKGHGNGYGFHPGTGSLRSAVRDCVARGNGDIGLYVCWNIQRGTFERNLLEGNGNHGISIGHNDTDNVFIGNTIRGNGHAGVWFRRENPTADRNVFRGNIIEDNGSADRPGVGVQIVGGQDTVLEGNTIRDTRPEGQGRTQSIAVRAVGKKPVRVLIADDNRIEGAVEAPAAQHPAPVERAGAP